MEMEYFRFCGFPHTALRHFCFRKKTDPFFERMVLIEFWMFKCCYFPFQDVICMKGFHI
uniref:Uncharacterized protein n=1 Tax=Manihot esculenta TaxID=3983 RepID=A0A251L2Z5_MANES